MDAKIIDGKLEASKVLLEVREEIEKLSITPNLVAIVVGDYAPSDIYVRTKMKIASSVGINVNRIDLPKTTTISELGKLIEELNNDKSVNAILVQAPLPNDVINKSSRELKLVANLISPNKDVDGFNPKNVGKLYMGDDSGLVPCTALGCLRLIESTGIELLGKHAVVIGRSNIVGRPTSALLLQKDCTVTIAHSKTHDLIGICKNADILVVAVGKPNFITKDYVKKGSIAIDVGINRDSMGKICGDIDFDSVKSVAGYISPVPKGVGPMTIAYLMQNTLLCYKLQNNLDI